MFANAHRKKRNASTLTAGNVSRYLFYVQTKYTILYRSFITLLRKPDVIKSYYPPLNLFYFITGDKDLFYRQISSNLLSAFNNLALARLCDIAQKN
jgi:hypothetical protein